MIAGQSPSLQGRENPAGQARSIDEAIAVARDSRVDIPEDVSSVRAALEEALGMKFTGEKGEHFFRSTLVQTLFYGVFSAWVRWHGRGAPRKQKRDMRFAFTKLKTEGSGRRSLLPGTDLSGRLVPRRGSYWHRTRFPVAKDLLIPAEMISCSN
jgi:hypothetical protein